MALTQARAFGAHSGARYGSFAGRGAAAGAHPVDTLTQPRGHGAFTGKRYGSFAGRGGADGAHPVGVLTQPRAFGAFSGKRYGSFAGRGPAAGTHPVGVLTQPRGWGAFTGRRFGDFSGRAESSQAAEPARYGGGGRRQRDLAQRVREHWEYLEQLQRGEAPAVAAPAPARDLAPAAAAPPQAAPLPAAVEPAADLEALALARERAAIAGEESALLAILLQAEAGQVRVTVAPGPVRPPTDDELATIVAAVLAADPSMTR